MLIMDIFIDDFFLSPLSFEWRRWDASIMIIIKERKHENISVSSSFLFLSIFFMTDMYVFMRESVHTSMWSESKSIPPTLHQISLRNKASIYRDKWLLLLMKIDVSLSLIIIIIIKQALSHKQGNITFLSLLWFVDYGFSWDVHRHG